LIISIYFSLFLLLFTAFAAEFFFTPTPDVTPRRCFRLLLIFDARVFLRHFAASATTPQYNAAVR